MNIAVRDKENLDLLLRIANNVLVSVSNYPGHHLDTDFIQKKIIPILEEHLGDIDIHQFTKVLSMLGGINLRFNRILDAIYMYRRSLTIEKKFKVSDTRDIIKKEEKLIKFCIKNRLFQEALEITNECLLSCHFYYGNEGHETEKIEKIKTRLLEISGEKEVLVPEGSQQILI